MYVYVLGATWTFGQGTFGQGTVGQGKFGQHLIGMSHIWAKLPDIHSNCQ